MSRHSVLVTRLKTNLIYHRLYPDPPPRSELALSQITDEGLPPLIPPPLPAAPSRPTTMPQEDGPSTPFEPPTSTLIWRPPIPQTEDPSPLTHRKVKIVCVSDTHNADPVNGSFRIPPGDILIHAGDLTNQGSYPELSRAVRWILEQPHELKIVIAGNHDGVTLDADFHQEYAGYFKFPRPQDQTENKNLFLSREARGAGMVYMQHEHHVFTLRDGRRLSVFASPYTPKKGLWGFGYESNDAEKIWRDIPDGVDLVITHGPPKYHLDHSPSTLPPVYRGCEELRKRLAKVRPRVCVFGHVHEGYGVEVVTWGKEGGWVEGKEEACRRLEETPGRKKWTVRVEREGCERGRDTVMVNCAVKGRVGGGGKAVGVEMVVPVVPGWGEAGV